MKWLQSREEIGCYIKGYFKNLFAGSSNHFPSNLEEVISSRVSAEDNAQLYRIPDEVEIWAAVRSIGGSKSPELDGFTAIFYQKYWKTIQTKVIKMIQHFFVNGYMLKQMNHSFIALIPKVDNPDQVKQFRPIAFVTLVTISYPKFWRLGSKYLCPSWCLITKMFLFLRDIYRTILSWSMK